jgi:hypothetical protein
VSKVVEEGLYLNPFHRHRQPTLQRVVAGADRRLCPVPPQRTVTDRGSTHQRSVDVVVTVISLWQSGVQSGAVGNIVRINKATVLFKSMIGGKTVGTRGPGQGVQVGDAVGARQALGWGDQH